MGRGKREAGDSASGAREGGSCRVEWTSEIVVERLGSAETLTVTRSPAVLQTSARLLSETKTSQHHPRTSPRAPTRGASYFYEQRVLNRLKSCFNLTEPAIRPTLGIVMGFERTEYR